jgi:hypothetical protein
MMREEIAAAIESVFTNHGGLMGRLSMKAGDTFTYHGKPVRIIAVQEKDASQYDYEVEYDNGQRGFIMASGILDDLKDVHTKLERLEKFERMLALIKKWEADPTHFNRMKWCQIMEELSK